MGPLRLGTVLFALILTLSAGVEEALAQGCSTPCVGPRRGSLMAVGGGTIPEDIYRRFLRMAGGPDARIVLIPTAGAEDGSHDAWTALERLRDAGARRIEVLHTRNRRIADLEAFAGPLGDASGVWISGGRQWRLSQVYLHTRTHQELQGVLDRGGVVAGNSAGASALASFLVRGARDTNEVLVEPENQEGFGFLRQVAIDQHLMARGRENDLMELLRTHPQLLGLGLNEGGALIVTGDLAEVVGARVAVYDVTDPLHLLPLRWLAPGSVYDLGARTVILDGAEEPAPTEWPPTGSPPTGFPRTAPPADAPSSPDPASRADPAPP